LYGESSIEKRFSTCSPLFWTDFDTQDIDAVDVVINVRYPKKFSLFNDQGMVFEFCQRTDAYQMHYHSKRCDFPMASVGSVILNKWPDMPEYVVTTIILPGTQKKEISCLIILHRWHPFELIIASK
jgi:hypothetical protein